MQKIQILSQHVVREKRRISEGRMSTYILLASADEKERLKKYANVNHYVIVSSTPERVTLLQYVLLSQ
jgi:hypothetical protein